MEQLKTYPGHQYQCLFNLMLNQHGNTLLQSEMDEIIGIVHKDFPAQPLAVIEDDKEWIVVETAKAFPVKYGLLDSVSVPGYKKMGTVDQNESHRNAAISLLTAYSTRAAEVKQENAELRALANERLESLVDCAKNYNEARIELTQAREALKQIEECCGTVSFSSHNQMKEAIEGAMQIANNAQHILNPIK